MMKTMSPDIPYAKYGAVAPRNDLLKERSVVEHILNVIDNEYSRNLVSSKLIEYVLRNIQSIEEKPPIKKSGMGRKNKIRSILKQLRKIMEKNMPHFLENFLINSFFKAKLDANLLAFRVYIICRMNKMLNEDAMAMNVKDE